MANPNSSDGSDRGCAPTPDVTQLGNLADHKIDDVRTAHACASASGAGEIEGKGFPSLTVPIPFDQLPKDLRDKTRTLAFEDPSAQTPPESSKRVRDAIATLDSKYGEDRVRQMFDTLGKVDPLGKFDGYRFELKTGKYDAPGRQERVQQNLRNLDWLCQRGNLEKVSDLVSQMRAEGYTQKFSLAQMNETLVKQLANPEERKAFITLENSSRQSLAAATFMSKHPEMQSDAVPPTVKLRAFEKWQQAPD